MTSPPYVVSGYALKFNSCKYAISIRMNTKKWVNHSSICPKLYAIQYVHLCQDHNNEKTKYSILE